MVVFLLLLFVCLFIIYFYHSSFASLQDNKKEGLKEYNIFYVSFMTIL